MPVLGGNSTNIQPIPHKEDYENEEEWYADCIRSINRYWADNISPNYFGDGTDYIWRFIQLFKYAFGEQDNISFKFMEEAAEGISMPARWLPGKKLSSLLDHMKGNFLKTLQSYEINVYSLGRDAASEKKEMWDQLMLEAEMKEDLDKMEEQIGESMRMVKDFRPEDKEDVEDFMKNYKTYAEKLIYNLTSQTMQINNYEEKFTKLFIHAIITAVACMKCRVENGVLKWDVINPINVIFDKCDDDLQREMQFAGHHYWASLGEIEERYDLTADEREQVKKMAKSESNDFRAGLNDQHIDWFNKSETDIYIKVVEGEWFYPENKRQLKTVDKYGNEHFTRTDKKELTKRQKEKGHEIVNRPMNVVHKGALIGNSILKNHGVRPNQPRSKTNISETELSYHIMTPGIELGEMVSPAHKLAQHQDNIDLYMYKIQLAIENDYGKVLFADFSQIDPEIAADPVDLAKQIKTDSLVPYNSAKDEMQMGGRANGTYFYQEDFTLSQSVQFYQQLIQFEIQQMEEVASIPKMALGQQTSYQPREVQQKTISQSSLGNYYHYKIFGSYVNKILQYSANVTKILYTIDDNVFEKYNLGLGEIDFLDKVNKEDIAWEDFLAYVDIDDAIIDDDRNELVTEAQAAFQNGQLDWATYLQIKQAKTYSEAVRLSEKSVRQLRKLQTQQKKDDSQLEMMRAKMDGMKEMQLQQLKNQGALQEQQLENKGDVQEQYAENQGNLMEQIIKAFADADQKERDRMMQLIQQNQQSGQQNQSSAR